MNREPVTPVWGAVALILGVTLISGPLVAGVDITSPPPKHEPDFCEPTGNATTTVKHVPDESFEFEQRRFGVQKYYVTADDLKVVADDVAGCPVLVYRFEIPELDHTSQRLYFLGDEERESVSLSIMEVEFQPNDVEQRPYDAVLTIRLRADSPRTIYRSNVTIQPYE